MAKKTSFRQKAIEVSESTGIDVEFYQDKRSGSDCFEDDGCLHVRVLGLRACFDVNQGSDSGTRQNENTRKVLTALGMPDKIGDRTLTENDLDEEDCCCSVCRAYREQYGRAY